MCALRRVADDRAGPDALGILLPPGARTVLIVRPRALAWDLLLIDGVAGTRFRELAKDEAPAVAAALFRALEAWGRGGHGLIDAVAAGDGRGYLVWADVGDFALVACARRPGQAYQPLVFTGRDEARAAAARLAEVLHPPAGREQEVYFNTRNFVR
jgi:hypothetical protein